ncbi:MAG: twin-arginine translocase TatA/TatE family subunit [Rickettsiales bacterium]|nr:twin-arginine translocase TatA/TatE family subunit [Rickettsiales bacterium]
MLSAWQIFVIIAVVLILFGAGRIPRIMKDIGSGMRAFKEGLEGDSDKEDKKKKRISKKEE